MGGTLGRISCGGDFNKLGCAVVLFDFLNFSKWIFKFVKLNFLSNPYFGFLVIIGSLKGLSKCVAVSCVVGTTLSLDSDRLK